MVYGGMVFADEIKKTLSTFFTVQYATPSSWKNCSKTGKE